MDEHLVGYYEAFRKAIRLKVKKQKDYNSGGVCRGDYALHGDQTFLDELWKKTLRLVSLDASGKFEEAGNETVDDTLLDVMNYAADWYGWRRQVKMERNHGRSGPWPSRDDVTVEDCR